MFNIARLAPALVAFGLLAASPLTASAKDKPAASGHAKGDVKAEDFRKVIDKRIAEINDKLEKQLDKAKLTDEKKAEIKKDVDAAEKQVKSAVDKAAEDGIVTKEEAKQVKVAAGHLKDILKKELGAADHAKPHHRRAKK